MLVAAEKADQ